MKTARNYLRLGALLVAGALLSACHQSAPPLATDSSPSKRPNILLIVADDMGFSDIGAFGGEIDTPNIDKLAQTGLRMTDFHVAPTCSPTRAMLLTGNDAHVTGLGTMAEAIKPEQRGKPGYEGHLNHSVATIAERLQEQGYFTAMAGKWHLGYAPDQLPAARGFQRSFALLNGAANYYGADQDIAQWGPLFTARYAENGQPSRLPEGAYTTDYFSTRLIEFLNQGALSSHKPFFAYLAFNAPHTPLQAPQDLVDKYNGRYDQGPEALREQRVVNLAKLGLITSHPNLGPMEEVTSWDDLSDTQQKASARRMQIYAAAVDRLDYNVGRVISALRDSGQLENTIIIFMSDNGAEGTDEDIWLDFQQFLGLPAETATTLRQGNHDLTKMGSAQSYTAYGPGWAQAGMAPFSLTKGYTTEGGIRAPLIISGPGILQDKIDHSFAHVTDIVPTVLELTGIEASPSIHGKPVHKPQGRSLKDIWTGQQSDASTPQQRTEGWEFLGRRAIRSGPWKAVYMNTPSIKDGSGSGPAYWKLYNLQDDPGETTDLSANHTDILSDLTSKWSQYASENGVVLVPPIERRGSVKQTPETNQRQTK